MNTDNPANFEVTRNYTLFLSQCRTKSQDVPRYLLGLATVPGENHYCHQDSRDTMGFP